MTLQLREQCNADLHEFESLSFIDWNWSQTRAHYVSASFEVACERNLSAHMISNDKAKFIFRKATWRHPCPLCAYIRSVRKFQLNLKLSCNASESIRILLALHCTRYRAHSINIIITTNWMAKPHIQHSARAHTATPFASTYEPIFASSIFRLWCAVCSPNAIAAVVRHAVLIAKSNNCSGNQFPQFY